MDTSAAADRAVYAAREQGFWATKIQQGDFYFVQGVRGRNRLNMRFIDWGIGIHDFGWWAARI